MKPRIMIMHATGTNRDRETAWACELAGGTPEIVHVNQIVSGAKCLNDYQMLILPGGFSYGDNLGAGKQWGFNLQNDFGNQLIIFADTDKPILGICNGFQALVHAGLLHGRLVENDSAHFECRWVYLQPEGNSIFTRDLTEPIYCPVAHGFGKYISQDTKLVAFRYVDNTGERANYPYNPNGSQLNIAGISNIKGNILGLMPHPENHLIPEHHPQFHRGKRGLMGLPLFKAAIQNL